MTSTHTIMTYMQKFAFGVMYLNESILGLGTTRTKCDAGKYRSAEQAAEAGVGGHERRTG